MHKPGGGKGLQTAPAIELHLRFVEVEDLLQEEVLRVLKGLVADLGRRAEAGRGDWQDTYKENLPPVS